MSCGRLQQVARRGRRLVPDVLDAPEVLSVGVGGLASHEDGILARVVDVDDPLFVPRTRPAAVRVDRRALRSLHLRLPHPFAGGAVAVRSRANGSDEILVTAAVQQTAVALHPDGTDVQFVHLRDGTGNVGWRERRVVHHLDARDVLAADVTALAR